MLDTRTQIIDLAEESIRSKGFNAFSYRDISKVLNIKNAAIHYHFPSKANLGKAVIDRTRERFKEETEAWKVLSPDQRLKNFIGIYEKIEAKNLICFMGSLGTDHITLPREMQESLTESAREIRQWLTNVLKEGKETGVFSFKEGLEERANIIVCSLLSSLILTRVTGDNVVSSVGNGVLKGM
mgnify:CR=1 FL=1